LNFKINVQGRDDSPNSKLAAKHISSILGRLAMNILQKSESYINLNFLQYENCN